MPTRQPTQASRLSNQKQCRYGLPVQKIDTRGPRRPRSDDVPRLFGTDGVRGTAGRYPLDPPTVRRIGAALVRALPNGTDSARLLVGRDTRESGTWIEAELAHGAAGEGAMVTTAALGPTP